MAQLILTTTASNVTVNETISYSIMIINQTGNLINVSLNNPLPKLNSGNLWNISNPILNMVTDENGNQTLTGNIVMSQVINFSLYATTGPNDIGNYVINVSINSVYGPISRSLTITVNDTPKVQLTSNISTVEVGKPVSYNITINTGSKSSNDLTFIQNLSPNVFWTLRSGRGYFNITNTQLSMKSGLNPGIYNAVLQGIPLSPLNNQSLTNTANIIINNASVSSSSVTVSVISPPQKSISIVPAVPVISSGDSLNIVSTINSIGSTAVNFFNLNFLRNIGLGLSIIYNNGGVFSLNGTATVFTPNGQGVYTVVYKVDIPSTLTPGNLTFSMTTRFGTDPQINLDSNVLVVSPPSISQTINSQNVAAGSNAGFNINVTTGNFNSNEITFVDILPNGAYWSLPVGEQNFSIVVTPDGQKLTISPGLSYGSYSTTLQAVPGIELIGGTLSNTVTFSTPTSTFPLITRSINVTEPFKIIKSTTSNNVTPGSPINYTVSFTSKAPYLINSFVDSLPTGNGIILPWTTSSPYFSIVDNNLVFSRTNQLLQPNTTYKANVTAQTDPSTSANSIFINNATVDVTIANVKRSITASATASTSN